MSNHEKREFKLGLTDMRQEILFEDFDNHVLERFLDQLFQVFEQLADHFLTNIDRFLDNFIDDFLTGLNFCNMV